MLKLLYILFIDNLFCYNTCHIAKRIKNKRNKRNNHNDRNRVASINKNIQKYK
jgi:hypothetical protein